MRVLLILLTLALVASNPAQKMQIHSNGNKTSIAVPAIDSMRILPAVKPIITDYSPREICPAKW